MPDIPLAPLPPCLSAPHTLEQAPGLVLARCDYRPDRFDEDAFGQAGIDAPAGLALAIAKRRTEYLAGRACARAALQQALGLDTPPGIGADRAPVWPAAAVGAITHSHGEAAALVGDRALWRGVGLDRERWLTPTRAERLRGELLTPRENDALTAMSPEQRARWVTLSFSVKESLFKALFPLVGKRFYFQDAALEGEDRIRLLTTLSSDWRQGQTLPVLRREDDAGLLSWIQIPA